MSGPPLRTIPEAAETCGISQKVLRRLIASGAVPGTIHAGRRWYLKRAVIERRLEGGEAPPPASRAARGAPP